MSKNPQERPDPPVFPPVNRPPLTRREARLAREADEQARGRDEDENVRAVETATPEAEPETGVEAAQPADAGHAVGADDADHDAPAEWMSPTAESQSETAALAGLDFDAVITGPVSTVPDERSETEREPVGVAARHGSDETVGSHHEHPGAALFGTFGHRAHPEDGESASDESPLAWRQQNYLSDEPKRRRRWVRPLVVIVVIVAVLGGMAAGAYVLFQPQVAKLVAAMTPEDNDYRGDGTGEVLFTIASGDTGDTIATNLHKAGVTKSYDAFYSLLLRQKPEPEFQPGVFRLAKQMSAQSALIALQDPASRVESAVVIPEGTAEKDVLQSVSDKTGIPLAELQQAAANPADYGLPPEAKTLEGFLFPATYQFAPGTTAHDAIKMMVDRMFQALDQAGVAPEDRWNTVVLASIVQREAGLKDDYPKVSRVFLNRLAQGWDLQSDATVAYGTGNTHRVETTDAERGDASNLYNTYVHPGLPVGPISNPGDLAINAVVHPADGPWMFFVTWNLETGETIFSTTAAEHEAAVQKWQQWMKDNPGYE